MEAASGVGVAAGVEANAGADVAGEATFVVADGAETAVEVAIAIGETAGAAVGALEDVKLFLFW